MTRRVKGRILAVGILCIPLAGLLILEATWIPEQFWLEHTLSEADRLEVYSEAEPQGDSPLLTERNPELLRSLIRSTRLVEPEAHGCAVGRGFLFYRGTSVLALISFEHARYFRWRSPSGYVWRLTPESGERWSKWLVDRGVNPLPERIER